MTELRLQRESQKVNMYCCGKPSETCHDVSKRISTHEKKALARRSLNISHLSTYIRKVKYSDALEEKDIKKELKNFTLYVSEAAETLFS